jgi:hypothetical protein
MSLGPEQRLAPYNVQVGHWRVTVQGTSRVDAIHAARQALKRDLPRLWDVISLLADQRFVVTPASGVQPTQSR